MIVLGLESSCDETAAAILQDGVTIRSSIVSSQVETHRQFGGVVPELASREHVDNVSFVAQEALRQADCRWKDVDGIAVTQGPGLVGALLVGLSFAKATAYSLGVPFVGVNHLEGHICSVFLNHPDAELPALSLVVSGGHTNLYALQRRDSYRLLARSRDDAAGEALDKLAKHLGLGYPGGPVIDRLSERGDEAAVAFSMPRFTDGSLDFSFSGLKSAALRLLAEDEWAGLIDDTRAAAESSQPLLDFVASYQKAVIDQLIDRLERALESNEAESVQVSGGVSCNRRLRQRFEEHFGDRLTVYFPTAELTTDNAVMIAAAGYQRLSAGHSDDWSLPADPNLQVRAS